MTDLDTLISDLERATEGSRELDYAIAKEIGWRFSGEESFKEYWQDATTDEWKQLPWWTTSLDSALTLVPEGSRWDVQQDYTCAFASIDGVTTGRVATPALALCIAALTARNHD